MTTAAVMADELYCDLKAALCAIDGYSRNSQHPWLYLEHYRLANKGGVLDKWPDIVRDSGAEVTITHPGTGRTVTYLRKSNSQGDGQRLRDAIEALMLWREEQLATKRIPEPASEHDDSANGEAILALPSAWRKAWLALQIAIEAEGKSLTYAVAWEWLHENGMDDYPLPKMRTFCDYCSKAAKRLGETRKSSRVGRSGRSIARQSEI